jgi:flagellar protein FlaG
MDVNTIGAVAYEMPMPVQQFAPVSQPQTPASAETPAAEVRPQNNTPQASSNQQAQPNQAAEKAQQEQPDSETVSKALEQINKALVSYGREMHISVHSKLNRIMVKVMDIKENKVIREIPPERVLDAFAKTLELAGILVDKKS